MNNDRFPKRTLLTLIIGELSASLIVCAVYLIIQKFTFQVPLGALLGSLVVIINFTVMAIMSNRIIDAFLKERGDGEMDDEQTAELVKKYEGRIQNQMKLSYIVRSVAMLVTLVLAFLIDAFDVIATLIPLLIFRPLITISEMLDARRAKRSAYGQGSAENKLDE